MSFTNILRSPSLLSTNLFVVAAMVLSGAAVFLLGTAPQLPSIMWPPAGIGLVALLLSGPRLIPGVLAGAFLIEGLLLEQVAPGLSPWTHLALSVAVGCGATLQAVVGWYLLRRKFGVTTELIEVRAIARFFLLAGPASCLINASLSVPLLSFYQAVPPDLLYSWLTWWLGDVFGILLFTSLGLILFAQPRSIWKPRLLTVALPLAVTAAISLTLYSISFQQAQKQADEEFLQLSAFVERSILNTISAYTATLYSLRGLFYASDRLDTEEFSRFSRDILSRHDGIRGLSWNPVVTLEQRLAYERQQRQTTGDKLFRIREYDPSGRLVSAPDREKYVVVSYIEPLEANRQALGYDVYSEPERRQALDKAMQTGTLAMTYPIHLVQQVERYGALIFLPAYRQRLLPENPEERSAGLAGYATLVVDIDYLMQLALSDVAIEGCNLELWANDRNGRPQLLFQRQPPHQDRLKSSLHPAQSYEAIIPIANHQWRLLLTVTDSFRGHSWGTWFVLVVVILFTSLLCFVLLDLSGRTITTRNLVKRRTNELSLLNEDLRESESRFRALVEQSITGIYVFQRDKFVYVNSRFCEIFGYSEEQVLSSLKPTDVIDANDRDTAQAQVDRRLSGQDDTAHYVARGLRGDGSKIWVEIHGTRMTLLGEPAITGTVLDITERKEAEDEVHRLNIDLEQRVVERTHQLELANKDLEAFTYSVSHDLRAPLRAIQGFTRIALEENAELPEITRGYMDRVVMSSKRMEQLIDSLLMLSKLGRQKLKRSTVDLTKLFRETIAEQKEQQRDRSLEYHLSQLPACNGDETLLRQVVVNLMSNAVKFTRKRQPAKIEIGAIKQGGATIFFVKDNGVGFNMTYAEKLFGVFQRLHNQEEYEGTGVGMAMVANIIRRHGGRIWAEAEPDKGATFYFTIGEKPLPPA